MNASLEFEVLKSLTPDIEHTPPTAPDQISLSDEHVTETVAIATDSTAVRGDPVQQQTFDPELHAVNADGTPRKKADGSFAKKRGRRSGSTLPPPGATAQQLLSDAADTMAVQTCNIIFNGCSMLFGEEWAPRDKAESEAMRSGFRDYYNARGIPKFPPELALGIVLIAYAAPRLNQPTMRNKMGQAWQWGKRKWIDWRKG